MRRAESTTSQQVQIGEDLVLAAPRALRRHVERLGASVEVVDLGIPGALHLRAHGGRQPFPADEHAAWRNAQPALQRPLGEPAEGAGIALQALRLKRVQTCLDFLDGVEYRHPQHLVGRPRGEADVGRAREMTCLVHEERRAQRPLDAMRRRQQQRCRRGRHPAPGIARVRDPAVDRRAGRAVDDDVLVQVQVQRVGVAPHPGFQVGTAQARVGDRLVESHHQVRFGDDRQMLQRDVRQVLLADSFPRVDLPVERGMLPGVGKELAQPCSAVIGGRRAVRVREPAHRWSGPGRR